MAKKKEEIEFSKEQLVVLPKIDPITTEFSREDLNEIKDKVNQIISVLFQ